MIGSLRHRVSIQKNVPTRTKGVKADAWQTLETVYAEVRPVGAFEAVAAEQREEIATHEVTMRHRTAWGGTLELVGGGLLTLQDGDELDLVSQGTPILSRYRLVFGSRTFDIRGIEEPLPRRRWTVMRVQERVT